MFESCRDALQDVREWSRGPAGCLGCPPGCPGVVGWPFRIIGSGRESSQMYGSGLRPSRMSGSGRETLPDDRKKSEKPPGCLRDPLGCPSVFGRPSWKSGGGWEFLLDVWERLGGPPRYPGVVGRPCRMSGSGGSPSRMSGSCRETLPNVQERWEALSDVREWSGGPPGCPGVVGRPRRMSGRGKKTLLNV